MGDFTFMTDNIPAYARNFDNTIEAFNEDMAKMKRVQDFLDDMLHKSCNNFETSIDAIVDKIRKNLVLLDKDLDAPHI